MKSDKTKKRINTALLAGSAIGMNQSGMNTQIDTIENYFRNDEELNVYKYDIWNYQKPDIIHFFGFGEGMIDVLRNARREGVKIISSPNHWPLKNLSEKLLMHINFKNIVFTNRQTKKFLVDHADVMVVNSTAEKRKFSEFFGVEKARIQIVYNSYGHEARVHSDMFVQKHKLSEPYFLMVGMVGPERKNHLRVFNIWKETFPLLVIVGDYYPSTYGEECLNEIEKKKNIKYVGFESDETIIDSAYQNCEAVISAGLIETPSLVAMRALLYGKTVCSTDAEGVPDEYFGGNAYYFNPLDESEIEVAITKALQKKIDVRQEDILRFSNSSVLENYRTIYKDLLH